MNKLVHHGLISSLSIVKMMKSGGGGGLEVLGCRSHGGKIENLSLKSLIERSQREVDRKRMLQWILKKCGVIL
jgi:hypothetical protein